MAAPPSGGCYLLEDHYMRLREENYTLEKEVADLEVATQTWHAHHSSLAEGALSPEASELKQRVVELEVLNELKTGIRAKARLLTSLRVRLAQRRNEIREAMQSPPGAEQQQPRHSLIGLTSPPLKELSYTQQQLPVALGSTPLRVQDLPRRGIAPASQDLARVGADGLAPSDEDIKVRAALISTGPSDDAAVTEHQANDIRDMRTVGQLEWDRAAADLDALDRVNHGGQETTLPSRIDESGLVESDGEAGGLPELAAHCMEFEPSPEALRSAAGGPSPFHGGVSSVYRPAGTVPVMYGATGVNTTVGNSTIRSPGDYQSVNPSPPPSQLHRAQSEAVDAALSPDMLTREEEFCSKEQIRLRAEFDEWKVKLSLQEKESQRLVRTKNAEKKKLEDKVHRLEAEIGEAVQMMQNVRKANQPLPTRPKVWHRPE